MASESRRLPTTNITRLAALVSGKRKYDMPGDHSFITDSTGEELGVLEPLYSEVMKNIDPAKAVFFNSNIKKNKASERCEMFNSHFVQVFTFGVNRTVFKRGDYAYFGLKKNGKLPDTRTDAKRLAFAKRLIKGDEKRVEAGGAPMKNPSIAEVTEAKTILENCMTTQNNSWELLKKAQNNCNKLNKRANECVKFLWGEVETKYSILPRATKRDMGRLWGIIYVKVGMMKLVNGTITDAETGELIIGATIYFENGNNDCESDTAGFKFNTTLMDVQKLICEHPLFLPWYQEIKLIENEHLSVDIRMTRKPEPSS